jgi:hypothetical protein
MFCIGFFNRPGWTAFVMSRRGLRVLGIFDENIYPA